MQKKILLLLFVFAVLSNIRLVAQNFLPIATSGYNIDGIAEASPASSYTSDVLDGSDYVLYSVAYGNIFSTGTGLPDNGTIVNGNRTYQLQAYNQNNILKITGGNSDSLILTSPARFSKISLLGFTTEGVGNADITIQFSDGSITAFSSQSLPDWFSGTGNIITSGFDRTGRLTDSPDYLFGQPYMYSLDFSLSCVDQAKQISTIIIHNNGTNQRICMIAVSATLPGVTSSRNTTICEGDTLNYNGHQYFAAGTYVDTLATSLGCDSIVTTTLTVNPTYVFSNSQSICATGSYTFNNHVYTSAGIYYDTLQTVTGCDSVIITTLTVDTLQLINNPQRICSNQPYAINGHSYSQPGSYTDTLSAITGCDSVIITILTVDTVHSVFNPQHICTGDSYSFNGNTYTIPGFYHDTLQSITGCDSIVVTILSVDTVPVVSFTISAPNDTLCSNSSNITFSGIPTGGVYSGSGGISGITFNPSTASLGLNTIVYTYANGACSDSASANIFVDVCTGINLLAEDSPILIYPNPATEAVYVELNGQKTMLTLMNINGREIATKSAANYTSFSLANLLSGIYLMKIATEKGSQFFKIVKQ